MYSGLPLFHYRYCHSIGRAQKGWIGCGSPDGWAWEPRQPEYEQMIMGVYMTLGVFLFLAARDPLANLSLIGFTIWSSIVHGGIMLLQAIVDDTERASLLGDIPALFLVAIVLWVLVAKAMGSATL